MTSCFFLSRATYQKPVLVSCQYQPHKIPYADFSLLEDFTLLHKRGYLLLESVRKKPTWSICTCCFCCYSFLTCDWIMNKFQTYFLFHIVFESIWEMYVFRKFFSAFIFCFIFNFQNENKSTDLCFCFFILIVFSSFP